MTDVAGDNIETNTWYRSPSGEDFVLIDSVAALEVSDRFDRPGVTQDVMIIYRRYKDGISTLHCMGRDGFAKLFTRVS